MGLSDHCERVADTDGECEEWMSFQEYVIVPLIQKCIGSLDGIPIPSFRALIYSRRGS